ncbi:RNA-binding protein 33 isoform X2 [Pseudoliparis swirei]|uniref:RNA-binding protein 33 isoform X2 n=1 Tax=Pseudoliparis swirei TaxID=2059687 RepID=UPI0024BE9F57|nr:RNA-binding protein 33 isoform X2 [Pseudoliparis swirei]
MSANAQNYNFDEYNKPGAERSRRRRGEDDDLESDLEEELLGEDWLSVKKNPSEVSDEELNDDLLQSDDEDVNMSGQSISVNATYSVGPSYGQQDNLHGAVDTDDVVNLGAEGCGEEDVQEEGYQHEGEEAFTQDYSQDNNAEMPEDQIDYTGEQAGADDCYQDEVLDIQINEPIDGEFQDDDYPTYDDRRLGAHGVQKQQGGGEEQQQEEEDAAKDSRVFDTDEVENDAGPEEEMKEESDEEDEEDEESGRIRFKSERKDGHVVRLADVGSNRRCIPETLELSDRAKQDLMQFEEQERQKKQNRYGGRGGMRGGMRGGRGRGGFPPFGMDFRGENRGRMIDHRISLLGNMGMQQPSSRMPLPHQQQLHSQQHHPSRPRGPPPFQDHGRPLAQQPLQPLIPPHMAHRSPPVRPQMEPPPRMMSSPPPNFPQHHLQQPPQSKNIHINPHFRGPTSSSVQVPLMPPAQSQPRPAVGPQRFPEPGDFQQHMTGNFGQPQRPPHHMEPYRNQPPQGPQDRETLFMGERTESTRFPGQHMFDHQGSSPLMNSSHNLHQQQQQQQQPQPQQLQLPGQGHMGFGPPGPAFNQPGQGPLGIFPREPPRPNIPPHQGHPGMVGLNQQGGPPNQPRPFMGLRQPFGQQGNLFPPPQVQFGMQVRLRGLLHGPSVSQLGHHDSLPSHQSMQQQQQQQQHRQELSHHQQQHLNVNEPRSMMHHGQNLFHQQQAHGSPRQMTPRPQNPQQRNMSNRQRMNTPISKQMQQRNSNLRELPVAPGNTNMNSARPAANIRPVAKATQGMHPGQNTQLVPDGGRGRGQVAARFEAQPGGSGRTVVRKEIPCMPSSTAPLDPNEDEETRQYRLKIEEQKRQREEILKRKEMRRQMQAGVRKKELLDRLNAQTPSQGPPPSHMQPSQQNPLASRPLLQQPPPQSQQQQQQQLQQQQQQLQLQLQQQQLQLQQQQQQQRQLPLRTQQSLNPSLKSLNQATPIPPNGSPHIPPPRPNVKARLQMVKGGTQQQQSPGPVPDQQWKPPQPTAFNHQQLLLLQQRRNSAVQNVNRPADQIQASQVPPKTIPVPASVVPGQAQALTQGPKPGAKRTVMQRAKNSSFEGQQVPQKVRVVKLSGASGNGSAVAAEPVQQQGSWSATPVNQAVQRKVTMTGQQQAPGGTPQAGRGVTGNPPQNRVVVSGRGRGVAQMGRGRPTTPGQSPKEAEGDRCTVSIEGLSSSTTDLQLKNLLRSIGPIEMFKMMPQQRKAMATFSSPQHAESFQMSFNRDIRLKANPDVKNRFL